MFKASYARTRERLRFGDRAVMIDADRHTFHARLPAPDRTPSVLHGNWTSRRGLLITVVAPSARGEPHA